VAVTTSKVEESWETRSRYVNVTGIAADVQDAVKRQPVAL
jgi:hypothetical protein